jgi:HK97 gp10 family phage protein
MVTITGADRVTKRLAGAAGAATVQKVGQALFAGGEIIRAEAAHLITEGAVSGKYHVPSLPGEPPNEDTGVLRANIETTQVEPLRIEVTSNAPYAVALEFGTSKMAARPYMGPAARAKKKEVVALVRRAINEAIKKG